MGVALAYVPRDGSERQRRETPVGHCLSVAAALLWTWVLAFGATGPVSARTLFLGLLPLSRSDVDADTVLSCRARLLAQKSEAGEYKTPQHNNNHIHIVLA